MSESPTGYPLIADEDLRLADLPAPDASYQEQLPFCGSIDGYAIAEAMRGDCIELADAAERKGLDRCSLAELRLIAFARQRQEKWYDQEPAPGWIFRSISNAIEAIRRRLGG